MFVFKICIHWKQLIWNCNNSPLLKYFLCIWCCSKVLTIHQLVQTLQCPCDEVGILSPTPFIGEDSKVHTSATSIHMAKQNWDSTASGNPPRLHFFATCGTWKSARPRRQSHAQLHTVHWVCTELCFSYVCLELILSWSFVSLLLVVDSCIKCIQYWKKHKASVPNADSFLFPLSYFILFYLETWLDWNSVNQPLTSVPPECWD